MSELPLPQWAHVPGETIKADADYETLAQVKLLVPSAFRGYVPARHPALRYGILLNDRGYFWEARNPGGGMGSRSARRTRAHSAARLHPDR